MIADKAPFIHRATAGWLPRCTHRLSQHRLHHLTIRARAELAGRVRGEKVPRIAARSFVNRAYNLTDLMLASRLIRASTYAKYGGRIPEPYLTELRERQRRRRPTILLTAYYGSFDMLPVFLGYNGIRADVVVAATRRLGDAFRFEVAVVEAHPITALDRGSTPRSFDPCN